MKTISTDAVKERPILLSAPMVRARAEGRKSKTRRIAKDVKHPDLGNLYAPSVLAREPAHVIHRSCPYGQPGDRLWVRETWGTLPAWDSVRPSALPIDLTDEVPSCQIFYGADSSGTSDLLGVKRWRPSIHMPRSASRTLLEVVSVRVERLQDISDKDILAEGLTDDLMKDLLLPAAAKCAVLDEYWIHNGDAGLSYCYDCCVREVARLNEKDPKGDFGVDGGWGIEGDGTVWCETCNHRLSNSLTDYGAEIEFKHFLEHGASLKNPDDCLSLYEAISSQLWTADHEFSHHSAFERECWIQRVELMHKACFRVLWESINGPGSWAANPWVWVVEFRDITSALGLLGEGGVA